MKRDPAGHGDPHEPVCRPGKIDELPPGPVLLGEKNGLLTVTIEGTLMEVGTEVGKHVVVAIDEAGVRVRKIGSTETRTFEFRDMFGCGAWN